jgi:hypothetical protein
MFNLSLSRQLSFPARADAGEPPATTAEGDDGGDMELAWQMLETSRVIFSNMAGASHVVAT